jgi:ribosomal protein S30
MASVAASAERLQPRHQDVCPARIRNQLVYAMRIVGGSSPSVWFSISLAETGRRLSTEDRGRMPSNGHPTAIGVSFALKLITKAVGLCGR